MTRDDVVYDLGCGDGRIVITAAERFGARGVGIDYDPERIAEANANAARRGVQDLVTFIQQDAMQADVSEATVVTLYLLSSSNRRLRPILTRQLSPGARIVSHAFRMGDWRPDDDARVRGRARHRAHPAPVARRRRRAPLGNANPPCRSGETGRRAGLKIPWALRPVWVRPPTSGTNPPSVHRGRLDARRDDPGDHLGQLVGRQVEGAGGDGAAGDLDGDPRPRCRTR